MRFSVLDTMLTLKKLVPLFLFLFSITSSQKPLEDQNWRVIFLSLDGVITAVRNGSGHIETTGIVTHIFEWMSNKLGFKYAFELELDSVIAAAPYLARGEMDVISGGIVMTDKRYQEFDMPYPWDVTYFQLMIPTPDSSADIAAPWKPFTVTVWILILFTIGTTIVVLRYSSRVVHCHFFSSWNRVVDYTVSVLFSQGSFCSSNFWTVRFLAGLWCLTAFFLVNFYNSTLISFIASPNYEPLIKSVYDIPDKPNVHVTVKVGQAPDVLLSAAQTGVMKSLADSLNRDPSFRCEMVEQCLKKVKSGPYVYMQTNMVLSTILYEDFKQYKKCEMTITKEGFMNVLLSISLPKNHKATNYLSQALFQLHDTGLLKLWHSWYFPTPAQCMNVKNVSQNTRLSLKNLSSAFVILLVGIGLSAIVFVIELAQTFEIFKQ